MNSLSLFANVSFKSGGKRTFTYIVPEEFAEQVCPGVRVEASFRGQPTVGFVIDLVDYTPIEREKLLPLEKVLDGEPRFPANVMQLILWATRYYHSTPGETMRAAYPFPSFIKPKARQMVSLAHSPEETMGWIHENENRRPRQVALLKVLLSKPQSMTRAELLEEAKATGSSLSSLLKEGLIRLTEKEILRRIHFADEDQHKKPIQLSPAQHASLESIVSSCRENKADVFLLQGVTGSGKTEIYLQAIEEVLRLGKTALALVPEISLTPQTMERFRSRFGDKVGILHSALGEGERFDEWRAARHGHLPVIVGTRSAIFCPLQNMGLLVIDEEHDHSYKQEDPAPRYHARDLAVMRGQIEGCPVVLGSATPSLESAHNAQIGKYRRLWLPSRVTGHDLPQVKVVDLRGRVGQEVIISTELANAIQAHTERKGQVILFLNRRGFSTLVLCRKCGYVFGCPNCSVGMVYHQQFKKLICHHCGEKQPEPRVCPECKQAWVRFQGAGTEQVTELVETLFPNLRVQRMDLDTTRRKGAHAAILGDFRRGKIDLLVGTQMISKGLDFPGVSLVGVISADVSLNLPDFRSGERTFSLLTQVAGRAGRGKEPGEVIIQSFSPRHYSIQLAIAQDYDHFFEKELAFRKIIAFPPITRLTNLRIESKDEKAGQEAGEQLKKTLQSVLDNDRELARVLRLWGPLPAPLYRLKTIYRWHLTIKGSSHEARRVLLDSPQVKELLLSPPRKTKYIVDVDPLSMA